MTCTYPQRWFAWLRMNRIATAVSALILILTTACSSLAGYQVRTVTIGPHNWLLLRDVAGYYGLTYAVSGQDLRMRSATHRLQLTMNRREMRVDGQSVWLGTAPTTYHGAVIIRDQDFRTILDPILRPASVPRQTIRTVLIDPGHGGNDQGASSRHLIEKNLTLRISRRVTEILRQKGYRVILSRETDRFIPLEQRDAIANRQNADLFVCIHANSAADHAVGGIETFALPPRGGSSTYEKRVSTTSKRGNQY
ncbi:MAG: N-acetylmuramoyl-L-alanine amidase, partial [bacterium]